MPAAQEPLIESLAAISSVLDSRQVKRPFVVLDQSAYQASGAARILEPLLTQRATTRFTGFEVNPKLSDVERGIEAFRNSAADFVIAFGGGTSIDLAKLIGGLAVQSHSARQIATGQAAIDVIGKPVMAIPTTAGTGSEATHFAVVYVDGNKHSVAHPSLLPRYAVVDAALTESLPPAMTAATGLDAFCQAIESIWAVAATEESLSYATEAATLAYENLVAATKAPTPAIRQAMCRASHLAGKAINLTKTTAPHALSYALTSRFGVPHGLAVAVTLAPLLAFNAEVTSDDCLDPRGVDAVQQRLKTVLNILGAADIETACGSISKLLTDLACPALGEICTADELRGIADSANAERLSNNPRRATSEQLFAVLSSPLPATLR